jgi:hypothetical protein
MTPAVAATPPAIVRTADRQPAHARLRNLMVVEDLKKDDGRESKRALAAVLRRRESFAHYPAALARDRGPNWLKMALNSQR